MNTNGRSLTQVDGPLTLAQVLIMSYNVSIVVKSNVGKSKMIEWIALGVYFAISIAAPVLIVWLFKDNK